MRAPETAAGKRGARLFLATMATGLVLSAAAASVWPESMIHTPPEYGMAEGHEDQIQALCAAKAAPELLILGDSRAVAGVAVTDIRAAGIDAKKVALGGTGIFASWASLDRLTDCGVRPKTVVMAFGTGHILDVGALMLRTTGYDLIRGSRAGHAYDMASQWEDSRVRRLTYKAISIAGTEMTLVDLVLLRPALRNVLERPALAAYNLAVNEEERVDFNTSGGDRLYGRADGSSELPDEAQYGPGQAVPQMNYRATEAIAGLGKEHGFDVLFYVLPVSETARTRLPRQLFDTSDAFLQGLPGMSVTPMNAVWALPDADFGDPSHVNARGRDKVTADFLSRFRALSGASETHDGVAVDPQILEQGRQ